MKKLAAVKNGLQIFEEDLVYAPTLNTNLGTTFRQRRVMASIAYRFCVSFKVPDKSTETSLMITYALNQIMDDAYYLRLNAIGELTTDKQIIEFIPSKRENHLLTIEECLKGSEAKAPTTCNNNLAEDIAKATLYVYQYKVKVSLSKNLKETFKHIDQAIKEGKVQLRTNQKGTVVEVNNELVFRKLEEPKPEEEPKQEEILQEEPMQEESHEEEIAAEETNEYDTAHFYLKYYVKQKKYVGMVEGFEKAIVVEHSSQKRAETFEVIMEQVFRLTSANKIFAYVGTDIANCKDIKDVLEAFKEYEGKEIKLQGYMIRPCSTLERVKKYVF